MYKPEPKLSPPQRDLAAQESAHASSRGDKTTVETVRDLATDGTVADSADFVNETLNADAKSIGNSGKFWPFT